jgi:alkylated DNA nucleotide flippase Atl1
MTRRNVDEDLRSDVLVDIPKHLETRLGGSGKMLKPSRASIEALVEKVPRGRVLTVALLRKVLAESRNAQLTCPFLTKRALMAIAEDAEAKAPFWRVVMASGEMIAAYPGGQQAQAKRLRSDGLTITSKAGKSRIANLRQSLATL